MVKKVKTQIEQFKRELSLSDKGKQFLEDRLFNSETVDFFNIGFCPPTSSYHFDLLNGRIIVPIYDTYGNPVAFGGRKIEAYEEQVLRFYQNKSSDLQGMEKTLKWKNSKWLNTPYTKSNFLFNLNNAKKHIFDSNLCIVVEGYFDVMRLHQLGFYNCVALCGTSLTVRHCEIIQRYCNQILIMLDGDDAGRTATNKSVTKARSKGLFAHLVDMPNGLDPDDLSQETIEIIIKEINKANEEVYVKL